jgi:hypothetical protein
MDYIIHRSATKSNTRDVVIKLNGARGRLDLNIWTGKLGLSVREKEDCEGRHLTRRQSRRGGLRYLPDEAVDFAACARKKMRPPMSLVVKEISAWRWIKRSSQSPEGTDEVRLSPEGVEEARRVRSGMGVGHG